MKIFVSGYFCCNLGDDLFVRILANRYPKMKFYLITEKSFCAPYEELKNVCVKKRNFFVKILDRIVRLMGKRNYYRNYIEKKCDFSILIGGSIFQQMCSSREEAKCSYKFRIGAINPTFIMGANFGPYESDFFLDETADFLKTKIDCCFRDSYSKNMFKSMENVRYANDIIFDVKKVFDCQGKRENNCVVSVIDLSKRKSLHKYQKSYMAFLERSITCLLEKGMSVTLLSFCEFEGDENCANAIMERFSNVERSQLRTLFYKGGNQQQILSAISTSSLMIATRFHAMILGFAYQVPTIPIMYDQKSLRVLDDLKLSDRAIAMDSLDYANINEIIPIVIENIEDVAACSEKQFAAVDKFIG